MNASGNFQISLRPIQIQANQAAFPSIHLVPAISGCFAVAHLCSLDEKGSLLFGIRGLTLARTLDIAELHLWYYKLREFLYLGGFGSSSCSQQPAICLDCHAILSWPLVYLRNALLFAFANPLFQMSQTHLGMPAYQISCDTRVVSCALRSTEYSGPKADVFTD